jgi:hypothetical protein
MFIQRSPWPQSHTPEDVRFSALTAAPAGGKLTLPRFGEALTLRVSPRGFLKRQRGGDLRAAPTLMRSTASGRASWGRFFCAWRAGQN